MKADDKSSPFYIRWREQAGYFHQHAANARIEHKMNTEAVIRAEIRDGLEVKLYDGSGKPIWMVDPVAVARKFDDAEEAELCGYPDWPYAHDEKGARIQATKRELLPATTRNLLLQTIPDYQSHSTVDVRHDHNVVHVQGSILKRPAALPATENDGDSALVRDMKEKLQASLAGKLGEKKPDSPVHIMGRMTGDKPDRVSSFAEDKPDIRDNPRAYEVPKLSPPKGTPQDYGRPAEKLDQASRGRGVPPAGGFKVG